MVNKRRILKNVNNIALIVTLACALYTVIWGEKIDTIYFMLCALLFKNNIQGLHENKKENVK